MSGACLRIQDGVLLTGRALDVALYAVKVAQRSRARNGLPRLLVLEELEAAMSPRGQTDIAEEPTGQSVDVVVAMTTEDAASALHCSARQARRLAPALGGRRVGGRWVYDHQAVLEHIEGRTAS